MFSNRLALPAFLVVGFAAYWNALHIPFIGDDMSRIVGAAGTFQQGLGPTLANVLPDRPFLTFTNWLDFRLFGLNVVAFKATSIALQCLAGFTLFRLLSYLSRKHLGVERETLPFLLGLLFVAHPVANQSINIVIQRGVVLAGLFGELSFLFYLRFLDTRRRHDYLLSFLCLLLGVLSKPFVAILPLIFCLYSFLLRKDISRKLTLGWVLPFLAPVLVPAMFLFFLKVNVQKGSVSGYPYALTQARVIFIYLRLFFLPLHLHYLYDIRASSGLFDQLTWLAVLGHAGILGLAAFVARKKPVLAFSVFAAYLGFLPESGLFPIKHLMFEHRTYFPFIFVFIGLGSVLIPLEEKFRTAIPVALLIPVFCWGCAARSAEINTPVKWVENTLSYDLNDHAFNHLILTDLFRIHEWAVGQEIADRLHARFPQVPSYAVFAKIFGYQGADAASQRRILESTSNALIRNRHSWFEPDVRQFLNLFVASRVRVLVDPGRADVLLEKLISPQMPEISETPEKFLPLLRDYSSILTSLRSRYEAQLKAGKPLSPDERVQYERVLMNLRPKPLLELPSARTIVSESRKGRK